MWLLFAIALGAPAPETSRLDRSGLCEVVPEDSVLVEYVLEGEELGAWVLDPEDCGALTWLDLGASAPLLQGAARFRDLLATGALEERFGRVGEPLVAGLVAPIDAQVGERTRWLVLTPQGALGSLPWSALPWRDGYLVEERIVGLVDDPEQLLRTPPAWRPSAVRLAIGEPFGALLVGGVDFPEIEAEPCLPEDLPPLPDTLREARRVRLALRGKVPRWATRLLTGEDATRAAVLQQASGRRFLHLATHGFARPGCPDPLTGAGLALADSPLTAADVTRLDLRGTELVVLSACDTAMGGSLDDDGLFGLRHAFLQAGARSLVLTLWPVEDEATRWLMVHLYVQLLGRRSTEVAEALGASQRALLARNRRRYGDGLPHTWAAFVAVGTWTRPWDPLRDLPLVPERD